MPRGVSIAKPDVTDEPDVAVTEETLSEADVVEEPDVTAAEPQPQPEPEAEPEPVGRLESFEAIRPNGDVVVVKRNIDTGEQTVSAK